MNGAAREREKREVNGGPRTREGMGGRTREGGGYTPRVGLDGQNAPVECEKKHLQTDLPSADPTMEKREKTNKQTLFSVTSLYQTKPSNAQFLPAARRLSRLKVRVEYKHPFTSEYNLNYTELHRPTNFGLNTPSQKTRVGGRVQNYC